MQCKQIKLLLVLMLLTTVYGQFMQQLGMVSRPFFPKVKLGLHKNQTLQSNNSAIAQNRTEISTTEASPNETTFSTEVKNTSTEVLETTTLSVEALGNQTATTKSS